MSVPSLSWQNEIAFICVSMAFKGRFHIPALTGMRTCGQMNSPVVSVFMLFVVPSLSWQMIPDREFMIVSHAAECHQKGI